MMREHRFRHLQVQHAGKLVGVITDRDIKLASSFQGGDALKVEEVMTPDPYFIGPDAPMDEVAYQMAEHKYGCAIIVQANDKVVGIFTSVDGMRLLGDSLKGVHKA